MPLLLNVDTATETASVSITLDGLSIDFLKNNNQKEHASFVHTAVAALLRNTGYTLPGIDAFAVTAGPGSYTGLRVGMAAAKGFCYALSKPLIAINTLEVMTKAALELTENEKANVLFCPMIDARRMEVFTAVYNSDLIALLAPQPVILAEKMFDFYKEDNKLLFFGSGSFKFKQMESSPKSVFADIQHSAIHLGNLADAAFMKKNFSDISYAEPTYCKDFQSISKRIF